MRVRFKCSRNFTVISQLYKIRCKGKTIGKYLRKNVRIWGRHYMSANRGGSLSKNQLRYENVSLVKGVLLKPSLWVYGMGGTLARKSASKTETSFFFINFIFLNY